MIGRYLASVLLDDEITASLQAIKELQFDLSRQVDGQFDDAFGATERLLVGNKRV